MTGLPDLEELVAALAARVDQLEAWRTEHEIGKLDRQRQVDFALDQLRSMRRAAPS